MKTSEVVTIAREVKRHPNAWLLFEVVKKDRSGRPVRGRLLFKSKDPDRAAEKIASFAGQGKSFYLTFTGEPIPKDYEVIF